MASGLAARNGGWIGLGALVAIFLLGVGLRVGEAWDGRAPVYDAQAYAAIARNLDEGNGFTVGAGATQPSSNYSPGLPLLVAGVYEATGGAHERLARVVLAVIGSLSILIAYAIGRRLGRALQRPRASEVAGVPAPVPQLESYASYRTVNSPVVWPALVGALAVAVYPALLEYQGMLMSEPLAAALLSGGVLAALWAWDGGWVRWLLPGALFGALAMVRPEYLGVAVLVALVIAVRRARDDWRGSFLRAAVFLGAALVVIAPWTIRNASALDRFVPISTGGGQVLYGGTYLPSGGDPEEVGAEVVRENPQLFAPAAAQRLRLEQILARLAHARYPEMEPDTALSKMGKEQLWDDVSDHTGEYAGFLAVKVGRIWFHPARDVMRGFPWIVLQWALVLLGLLGLAILAWLRRWEALLLATVFLAITLISALLVASPRRVLVLVPLLAALASTALAYLTASFGSASVATSQSRGRRRMRSPAPPRGSLTPPLKTVAAWIRALPERYGRRTLIALALIAVLGLVARAYVVVNPVANPADDSHAYYAISKALYTEGSFGGPEFHDSSDWSPGAPFLYAAAFYATGGAREGTARIVEALLGVATILVVFALGWRLGGRELGRWVGLFAAFAVEIYPPFLHTTGELMSEPPAMLTLPAAILAFLWASDRQRDLNRVVPGMRGRLAAWWAWLVPGLLFGLTAMFRPEYLLVAAAFAVLAFIRIAWASTGAVGRRNWTGGLAGAAVLLVAIVLPILPWTIRNYVVLDRVVPISTGGGKALYTGTYLPADGEYQRVKAILVQRYRHRDLAPDSEALNDVNPTPLFNRVAEEVQREHPGLSRDQALGKLGKENLSKYLGEDPVGYLAMTARKVGRMWSSGVGEAMNTTAGRVVQILLVVLGIAGLVLLGIWRRWWELLALATPIVLVTLVGAVSLAAPRRNEVLMTVVFPLSGLALSSAFAAISSDRRWSPPQPQASSPPN